jgi:hypothetical protein
MEKLPNKIFNQCKQIPSNELIYISKNGGKYYFGGVRCRRKGRECIYYLVPNNIKPEIPNIKGIEKEELEKLWKILKQKGIIKTDDIKTDFPELYNEGGCCFAGFYGIINFIFPNTFIKVHGFIKMIENEKK